MNFGDEVGKGGDFKWIPGWGYHFFPWIKFFSFEPSNFFECTIKGHTLHYLNINLVQEVLFKQRTLFCLYIPPPKKTVLPLFSYVPNVYHPIVKTLTNMDIYTEVILIFSIAVLFCNKSVPIKNISNQLLTLLQS